MRKTTPLPLLACVAGLVVSTAAAQASVDGLWKCKASGNIPIALLTISGGGYQMQAVKDSNWTLKDADSSNGSGDLDIQGNQISPTSGPLLDIYGAVGSYCGENEAGCSGESLMLGSTQGIPLGCWRDG